MSSDPEHFERRMDEWGRIFDIHYLNCKAPPQRVRYDGCKLERLDLVLSQTFPRPTSRWLRLRDRIASRLITWASWLGRYEMHYEFDMKYKEKSEET